MIGATLGSYRVVATIGHGGMGVVYRAEHALIGKHVAIKLLLPEMTRDHDLVNRFFNEARAAAVIKHPGLVEVFDFGHAEDGSAYIVMELLEGESLAARLAREARLPIAVALAIARQVASALHAAHERDIIHRDLKPENIFLLPDADAPGGVRTKVLDFGIAKLARDEERRSVKTKTGAVFGTPRYMAPEQCKNATNVDRRTDIYALGCILYEMLLGVAPFDYDNWGELVAAHIHETPARPTALDPGLPDGVEQILLRALQKRVDDRYPTMADVAHDIDVVWQSLAGDARGTLFTPPAGVPIPRRSAMRSAGGVGDAATVNASGVQRGGVGAAPTLPVTGEIAPRSVPSRKRTWLAFGAAAVAAAVGFYALSAGGQDDDAQPPVAAAQQVPAVAVDAAVALINSAPDASNAPPSERIRLHVESTPPGADVYRAADGIRLGKTPLVRDYERTDGVAELIVRLAGHRDARVALPTTQDGSAHVKLTKISKPARVRKGTGTKPGPAGPTVLDPYGGN